MVKVAVRLAPCLLAVACVATLAAPSASAGPAALTARPTAARQGIARTGVAIAAPLAGYLWSSGNLSYEFDTGSPAMIRIKKIKTGEYQVTLGNLAAITGGIVQVTPFNNQSTCAVDSWFPSGSDLDVFVFCYSLSGKPANSLFDLIVTQPVTKPPGTFDYSWVYRGSSSGTLVGQYEYNSAGKGNSVRHLGTGRYQVTFGGPASSGMQGTVKVSAYGLGAGDCAASGWHGTAKAVVIDVNCYTASGAAVDRLFDVTYATRTNLMGLAGFPMAPFPTSNALVSAVGQVQTQFNSEPKARVTVLHPRRGSYLVRLNGTNVQFTGGDVQVSPVTGSKAHCVVLKWVGGPHIRTAVTVSCLDGHGHSVDSAFTIQYVQGFLVV